MLVHCAIVRVTFALSAREVLPAPKMSPSFSAPMLVSVMLMRFMVCSAALLPVLYSIYSQLGLLEKNATSSLEARTLQWEAVGQWSRAQAGHEESLLTAHPPP